MAEQERKISSVVQAAMDAYKEKGIRNFEVEEWQVDGKPLVIYQKPLTVKDKALYNRSILTDSVVEAQVALIIRVCLDAQGGKMFNASDKLNLVNNVEHEVVAEIFLELSKLFEGQDDMAGK